MTRVSGQPIADPAVQRYRAILAYDGKPYRGFQRQAGNTPTVQGALEDALRHVTRQAVTVIGAGRTDTGVHASGQVVAFDVAWRHSAETLLRAVNANLPESVALQALTETEATFHPRFDARSRTYRYTLYVASVRQPHLTNSAWHVATRPLDLAVMRQGAALLLGTHDFAAFGQPPQGENTVRTLLRSEFENEHVFDPDIAMLRYTITANAFLYRMVRRIVGALARLGREQISLDAFAEAFQAADGQWPNQTAPAHGLSLTTVMYE